MNVRGVQVITIALIVFNCVSISAEKSVGEKVREATKDKIHDSYEYMSHLMSDLIDRERELMAQTRRWASDHWDTWTHTRPSYPDWPDLPEWVNNWQMPRWRPRIPEIRQLEELKHWYEENKHRVGDLFKLKQSDQTCKNANKNNEAIENQYDEHHEVMFPDVQRQRWQNRDAFHPLWSGRDGFDWPMMRKPSLETFRSMWRSIDDEWNYVMKRMKAFREMIPSGDETSSPSKMDGDRVGTGVGFGLGFGSPAIQWSKNDENQKQAILSTTLPTGFTLDNIKVEVIQDERGTKRVQVVGKDELTQHFTESGHLLPQGEPTKLIENDKTSAETKDVKHEKPVFHETRSRSFTRSINVPEEWKDLVTQKSVDAANKSFDKGIAKFVIG